MERRYIDKASLVAGASVCMKIESRGRLLMTLVCACVAWGHGTAQAEDGGQVSNATRALRSVGQGAVHLRDAEIFLACYRFREAVDHSPTWPMARFELGRCLRLVGDPHNEAQKHLMVAIRDQPRRSTFHLAMARLNEDHGDHQGARGSYETASRADGKASGVEGGLARHALESDGQAGLQRLRRLIAREPHDRAARYLHARIAESLGALDEAEASLRWLLDRSRDRCAASAALHAFGERQRRRSAMKDAAFACRH